ncbi:MAG: RluA family pseudouridine synthase [Candidatus Berkelbacteria bacterium]
MIKKIIVSKNEAGERLDIFLQKKLVDFSRSQIQEAIKNGQILVNGLSSKASLKIGDEDIIEINFDFFENLSKPAELIGEKIPLDVLFEDENIIVINKPSGMVVHPAHGNLTGTLVNALLDYAPEIISSKNDDSAYAAVRPGIVHRLDKDTSGIIIVAKNAKSLSSLSKQMHSKNINKTYTALVYGDAAKSGEIKSYLGRDKIDRKKMAVQDEANGKLAITKYSKIQKYIYGKAELSLMKIEIPTGRTHQIRVQMKSIGLPVIGDQTYFSKESKKISDELGIKRQLLHASKIVFHHPVNNKEIQIDSTLPTDFQAILGKIS